MSNPKLAIALAAFVAAPLASSAAPLCASFALACLGDAIGNTVPIGNGEIGGSIFFADPEAPGEPQHVFNQAFWFRVGATGGEARVSTVAASRPPVIVTGPDGLATAVAFRYRDALGRFDLGLDYLSAGGTVEKTAFTSRLSVLNRTDAPLDFHLFMRTYADLDINLGLESPSDYDAVIFPDPQRARQISPRGTVGVTYITDGPSPDGYRIATRPYSFFPGSGEDQIGDSLRNLSPTTFPSLPLASFPYAPTVSPALGMQWAWEWDWTLAPGASETIALYNVVALVETPEPASVALLAVSATVLAYARAFGRRGDGHRALRAFNPG